MKIHASIYYLNSHTNPFYACHFENYAACENIRFSSLIVAEDVSRNVLSDDERRETDVFAGCVIFKMASIKRICMGIQVINTRMNFQENTLCLVYLCLLASCVVIIPIRCDFSDFLLSRNLLNRYGSGNNHKNKHKNIIQ